MMIIELPNLLLKFPGGANQTRCFLHILNLVVKSILKQFDLPKTIADRGLDNALLELAGDLECEELQSQKSSDSDQDEDNMDGWIDERDLLTDSERDELDESVDPLRLMLTKVREIKSELELSLRTV